MSSLRGRASVEPNTNPTDNAQQNPLQISDSSFSEIFSEQVQHPSVELQQKFSDFFSSEQAQAENERIGLQQQRGIEVANQLLRKEELKRNQFLQQLNQLDTEVQPNEISPKKKFKWNLQHQKKYYHNKLKICFFHSYTIRFPCHYRKTTMSDYNG